MGSEIPEFGSSAPQYLWCGRAAQSLLPGAGVDLVLLAIAAAYAIAIIRTRRPIESRQIVSFTAGIASAVFILSGPVERLSLARLFTAYILQQFVLVMIAPPLLLAGTPDWMLRPLISNRIVAPAWRRLTNPLITFCTFAVVFAVIHLPAVCDQVCHIHPFYYGVRSLLLLVGLLLWWPLLSPLPEFPRLPYPARILYLFLLMVPMTAVSAPITMAESVLYDFYVPTPHPWGLSPLNDQVLGGLCMWVGQALYLMGQASRIFFEWASNESEAPSMIPDMRKIGSREYRK